MPRYYFNAKLGSETIVDAEGAEAESLDAVRVYLEEALDEFGAYLDPEWVFEISDELGEVLMRVCVGDLRGEH